MQISVSVHTHGAAVSGEKQAVIYGRGETDGGSFPAPLIKLLISVGPFLSLLHLVKQSPYHGLSACGESAYLHEPAEWSPLPQEWSPDKDDPEGHPLPACLPACLPALFSLVKLMCEILDLAWIIIVQLDVYSGFDSCFLGPKHNAPLQYTIVLLDSVGQARGLAYNLHRSRGKYIYIIANQQQRCIFFSVTGSCW